MLLNIIKIAIEKAYRYFTILKLLFPATKKTVDGFFWFYFLDSTMIREYLKLARSFNAVLIGMSPVMCVIAME